MADEHREGAGDQEQPKEEQEMKEEDRKKKIGGGGGEDEANVEVKKDETSVEMGKSSESIEAVSDSVNGGGEKAEGERDEGKAAEADKEEKPKPVKRGLLDEPVLMEGKRQRHAVERLAAVSSPPSKKGTLEAAGSGTSLGDIEFVNAGISKAQNETLRSLHRICYGTQGTASSRKRDLRKFNGFAFDEKSLDFEKKKTTAMKLTSNEMNAIAKILGSDRGHTKEETVVNVLRFLQKPEDKGKKVSPPKKRRNSSKSPRKGAKKSRTEKKGKKGSAEKKRKSKDTEEEESDDSDDAGQSEEKDDESSDNEDTPDSEAKLISPAKRGAEKKKSPRKSDASVSKSDKSKDDPSWGDGGPSNEEVEGAINEILRSVDLANCTMKQMCERIAEKFPNLDMATYKTPLKERVKAALEKMEDS